MFTRNEDEHKYWGLYHSLQYSSSVYDDRQTNNGKIILGDLCGSRLPKSGLKLSLARQPVGTVVHCLQFHNAEVSYVIPVIRSKNATL